MEVGFLSERVNAIKRFDEELTGLKVCVSGQLKHNCRTQNDHEKLLQNRHIFFMIFIYNIKYKSGKAG